MKETKNPNAAVVTPPPQTPKAGGTAITPPPETPKPDGAAITPPPETPKPDGAAVTPPPSEKKTAVFLRHKTQYSQYRRAGLVLSHKAECYEVTDSQLAVLKKDTWVVIEKEAPPK